MLEEFVAIDAEIDLEREPLLANDGFKVTAAPKSGPAQKDGIDYFVPQFGVDKDVTATLEHIKQQEKRLKHKYVPDSLKKGAAIPRDYFVPNQGVDRDILDSVKNLKDTENQLGPWNLNQLMLEQFVQVDEELVREPLLARGVVDTAGPWKNHPKATWP
jgi:hypothetical protein